MRWIVENDEYFTHITCRVVCRMCMESIFVVAHIYIHSNYMYKIVIIIHMSRAKMIEVMRNVMNGKRIS